MKRTAIRRQPNPVTRRLDAMLRKIVLARDVHCRRCGAGAREGRGFALQAAHIYGKGKYQAMRYDPRNVILLCQPCHYWWHAQGFGREASDKNEVRAWCIRELGKAYMGTLDLLAAHPGKVNRTLDGIYLQQELAKVEA